jgi:hypothetical protein
MPLPKFRFEVTGKVKARNIRGQEMRRVTLAAVESEAFASPEPLAKGQPPAPPDGAISILVNPEFAKAFDIGDQFDLIPREV